MSPLPTEISRREHEHRALLRAAFDAAIAAVHPTRTVPAHLPPAAGRTVLLAAGKAAVPMAEAYLAQRGEPAAGTVVTRHGESHGCLGSAPRIQVLEAGHPIPDEASERAALAMLQAVRGLTPEGRVVFLVSGGGSALLALPRPPLTLAAKRRLTADLLACGATIAEINCVRKKLSGIKAGRLALAAAPARMHVIAISDIPGDDPTDIASGPASPDRTTLEQARAVLRRYRLDGSAGIAAFLGDDANETPKPGDPAFGTVTTTVCARSADALEAAAHRLQRAGFTPVLLGDAIDRPATGLAREHAALALRFLAEDRRVALLSGGETTVEVRNRGGRGGRNGEYLLALASHLKGTPAIYALAADTDGIDGTQENAGAFIGPDTLARGAGRGLDAAALLAANCSWDFFASLGDLLITGSTGTNVNDLRMILVDAAASDGRAPGRATL